MASSDRELEQQLTEAGNKLLNPPTSVDELLTLLDQVENFLSRVEQSPSRSMQTALSPSMKALVEDELLKHSDVDVKVAVASCVSEITRITAPDAPYDDDKMKDVFQLIVSSFENLSDKSSRSYNKRALILETVAKVRSCVVMLDLECDGLIVEMFQHFLDAIRDDHPECVFSSMETIMTLVLEESEDISPELLSPVLASVKRDNEDVLPIARKLGERVFENCAVKLKPNLIQAVKSLGISLDDYSKVVASICEGATAAVELNDDKAFGEQLDDESKMAKASLDEAVQDDESKLTTASSEETAQVAKETLKKECCPEEVDPAIDRYPKSVLSNGVTKTGNEGISVDTESVKKPEHSRLVNQTLNVNLTSNVDTVDSDADKLVKSELKPEQSAKRRRRKPNSLINSAEPSDSSLADSEKEAEKMPDRQKKRSKDIRTSSDEGPAVEEAPPSENERETGIQLSSPKVLEGEDVNVASLSPSGCLPYESHPKKARRPKKKESLIQEDAPSVDVSVKASKGTSDSEVRPQRRARKKTPAGITNEDKTPAGIGTSKNEGEETSDSEAKPLRHLCKKGDANDSEAKPVKQSGKKVNTSNDIEGKSLLKTKEDGKRRGRGKDTTAKDLTKSSAKEDEMVSSPMSTRKSAKDEGHLEETRTITSKRKRTPGKASETVEYGENLVGLKVKVWWPKDEMFYEGVVDSFDPVKMKHKVLYTDGEEERLNLRKERWEFVEGDSVSNEERVTEDPSPIASSETHRKKKAKTISESLGKKEKMEEVSPIRGEAASSIKLKGTVTKSGRKFKDDGKLDNKSKDTTSKSSGKSEVDTGGKSKDHSKRSDKSVNEASRAAGKSKDVDGGTPKTTSKPKQDAPSTLNKSKSRTPQSGNKSNANGMGKVNSSSSKVKETADVKGKSSDSAKTPENVKGKSPDGLKARESEAKSGAKRRRVKS